MSRNYLLYSTQNLYTSNHISLHSSPIINIAYQIARVYHEFASKQSSCISSYVYKNDWILNIDSAIKDLFWWLRTFDCMSQFWLCRSNFVFLFFVSSSMFSSHFDLAFLISGFTCSPLKANQWSLRKEYNNSTIQYKQFGFTPVQSGNLGNERFRHSPGIWRKQFQGTETTESTKKPSIQEGKWITHTESSSESSVATIEVRILSSHIWHRTLLD